MVRKGRKILYGYRWMVVYGSMDGYGYAQFLTVETIDGDVVVGKGKANVKGQY